MDKRPPYKRFPLYCLLSWCNSKADNNDDDDEDDDDDDDDYDYDDDDDDDIDIDNEVINIYFHNVSSQATRG